MIVITIGELSMGKKLKCPAATQDLELNTKNRDASIKAEHIQYGPLNVDEPGDYWKDIAEHWNTTEKAAKKSLCGNCVAFDISPRMKECMPGETSDDEGVLGYCWMHHFKCHSARTCRTWAKGGPIEDDDISADWQERNKMDEMKAKPLFKKTKHPPYSEYVLALDEKKRKRRKKKKTKKDRCYRIAKRKYDVFPSAYASGAIVKCRQGKIWKDLKEEDIPLEEKKKKAGTESSKESSLRDWFKRKGAPGKSGGWVDCNTCRKDKKTGRTKCKPCGRQEGEKRAKYPACRPTPAACKERGRSKTWGKKSAKKVKNEVVSEHLSYHLKNKLSLTESVFRAGSEAYIDLVKEARVLWKMGGYEPKIEELELLQSDIGQFGIYEGEEVPLDTPMLVEVELEEAKKKKTKKKPKLNKPMRNTGGGKKYKVFVRNPKTGNIKKVTFGDKKGGLEGNWNDPEARASFAKRHKCAEKKDKTKAGYWACRAHKYFGKNVPGRFW